MSSFHGGRHRWGEKGRKITQAQSKNNLELEGFQGVSLLFFKTRMAADSGCCVEKDSEAV